MNDLLRPRIWASFLASSGHAPCDVLSSTSRVRVPAVARLQAHLHHLVTAIHEISGLEKPAQKKPPAMFRLNTVRGNTVRTAQTLTHYTQIALKRNTKNSYFVVFFFLFLLTRNFLQVFVKIAICGQYHPRLAVLLLPVEF